MLVSIIIPCHNSAASIDRAVESVFSQTWEQWELILINNNSTDETWEKLQEIKKSNPERPIIVLDEKKKGAPAARNKGLFVAKGEWIQFLDADDELLSYKIEKQLKSNSNADLIIGGALLNNSNSSIETRLLNQDAWVGLLKSQLGITSSNLFKRKKILEINGWDESITSSQEYELMFRMLKSNSVISIVSDADTIIYDSQTSISRDSNKNRILAIVKNRLDLRFSIVDYLKKEKKLNNQHKKALKESLMNNLLFYGNHMPLYAWKIFILKIFLVNPRLKDFKHLLMITLFYEKNI